jgi:outer membrane immunogenic protein
MKRWVPALAAVAAFTGSAVAADLPARTYSKAPPPPASVASWTGCYVGGGGGYGLWNQENTAFTNGPPPVQFSATTTTGGRGYFGTVGGGCDYQFPALGTQFVIGAFGDYDFASLKGKVNPPAVIGALGDEKMSSAWSVGGRIGWLALPGLLTYVSAGYTEATFDRTNLNFAFGPPFGVSAGVFIDRNTYNGYFIGVGDEYALNFLPGLFWKTEYRLSTFDTRTNPIRTTATGAPFGVLDDSRKWVQTVRSELVYRFNSGGPVAAKALPPPVSLVNWTGCYVGGGGGYGLWDQENTAYVDGPPRSQVTDTSTTGGRGYFGTVQGGCDYQFPISNWSFVVGAFGDYDWSGLKGTYNTPNALQAGTEKMSSAWSVGGRTGWLIVPSLLTYVSAGYTEAKFDQIDLFSTFFPITPLGLNIGSHTYKGWFIGAGDEYALSFVRGLFWKTEYRFSGLDAETNPIRTTATGGLTGVSVDSQKWVHTVRTELVYRFNWGGPVVAKY